MRLSVSDKYRQGYRLAAQGAQNSVPAPWGGICGLNPQTKTQSPNWNTRN